MRFPTYEEIYQEILQKAFSGPEENPLPRPPAREVQGEIGIGYLYGTRFIAGLSREALNQHCAILGRTGAGKTNTMRVLIEQHIGLRIPWCAFELTKRNLRYLLVEKKVVLFRATKELCINLLEIPTGVEYGIWLTDLSQTMAEVFGLKGASMNVLGEALDNLYRKFDSQRTGCFPTIRDLHVT